MLGRLLAQLDEPRRRRRPRAHPPGLGAGGRRDRRLGTGAHRGDAGIDGGPAGDRRRSRGSPAGRSSCCSADIVTHREALAGLLEDPRIGTGVLTGAGWLARPFAFRVRSRRGRVVSAASPYHAVHARPARSSACSRSPAPTGPRWPPRPDSSPSSPRRRRPTGGGARAQGCDVARRARRKPATSGPEARRRDDDAASLDAPTSPSRAAEARRRRLAEARRRARPRTRCCPTEDEARLRDARGGRPGRTSPRCCSSGSCARAPRSATSLLRQLFWARAAVARRGRACRRADRPATTRTGSLLESAVKANDGFFTTFFVEPVLEATSRAGRRAAGSRPTRSPRSRCPDRRAGRRGVRHRRALGSDRRRGAAPAGVHARLRRRPARALHAHVLEARRLAGLDLRPREGVPRVRRSRDRRRAARATRCGCSPAPR